MLKHTKLKLESLESRQMLSANLPQLHVLASHGAAQPPAYVAPAPENVAPAAPPIASHNATNEPATNEPAAEARVEPINAPVLATPPQTALPPAVASVPGETLRRVLASSGSAAISARWDWLAQTVWFVPTENLLAYATSSALTNQLPVGDQTVWYINQAVDGHITGEAVTVLSINSTPSHKPFVGVVTDSGQVRIEFLPGAGNAASGDVTTGIGQMRFVQGSYRFEMQMATDSSVIVTHWAYMSQLAPGGIPVDPSGNLPLDPSLLSNQWQWLAGTQWTIADTALFGTSSGGVFEIDTFRGGYFWGSGTGTQPFNVMGSVTPEGNLLLLVSVNGDAPGVRTGLILHPTASTGRMMLRTYEGQPAVGTATLIATPAPTPITPHFAGKRAFLSST